MMFAQCPHCRSVDYRSVGPRNFIEQALLWLFQPNRCGLCGRHFFLIAWHSRDAG
jgi:hypothetical protein